MMVLRKKYNNCTSVLSEKLREFFYGEFYLSIVAVITALSYCFNLSLIGLAFLCFFAVITLLLYDDLTPFMPLPMVVLLLVRDLNMFLQWQTYVPLSFVFFALIFHFIMFPLKLKRARLYLPLIVLSISLLTSGLFAENIFSYYYMGLFSRIGTGPLMLFVYYLFINGINTPKNFDIKKYVCYILTLIGLICFIELFLHNQLVKNKAEGILSYHVGWNNVNGVSALLLVCIPACFYLLVSGESIIACVLSIACMYRAMYFTGSDACLGISLIALPILCLFAFIKSDKKTRRSLLLLAFIVLIGLTLILIYAHDENGNYAIIEQIKENIFFDNGRTLLYVEALENFLKYPVFGIGIGYCPPETKIETTVVIAYNYHSTFFHTIATMGVVGLIAFVWYFIRRYQILMHDNDKFHLFSFLSFTLMEAYGMIDTCEFNIVPLMLIVTLMITVVEISNREKNCILPLKKQP